MMKSMKNMLCMLMLLIGGVSMAQAKVVFSLSKSTLHIAPGETAELSVNIENDVDVYGLQCDITLPEGLHFVKSEAENGIFDNGTRFPEGLDILKIDTDNLSNTQTVRFAITPRMNAFNYLKAGSGDVVTFKVTAIAPTLGDSIMFSKVNAYDADDALYGDVTAKNSGVKNSMTNPNIVLSTETTGLIEWQKETPIVVNLLTAVPSNSNPVSNVQFDVTMPTGTKLTGEFGRGERLQNSHVVLIQKTEAADNTYRVTIQSSSDGALIGNSGSLVTLYATTGSAYAADSDKAIVISNQVYSKTDGTKVAPDPELETIEVPVTFAEGSMSKIQADTNGDDVVDAADIQSILNNLGTTDKKNDANRDGEVDAADIQFILNNI